MELISIIVPVFNKARFLYDSVRSVLLQNYKNIEIVLIDDGSSDGSGEICDRLSEEDERVVVFHQKNSGVSAARNQGIEKASGRYIMFFDADDRATAEWCSTLHSAISEENVKLAVCGVVKQDMEGRETGRHVSENTETFSVSEFLGLLNREFLSSIWDKIYDTDIIKKGNVRFDINTICWEDLIFNLDYLQAAGAKDAKITCLREVLYFYKSVSDGLSKKYTPWQYASDNILARIKTLGENYCVQKEENIPFYNKRCCEWCLKEIHYQTRLNKNDKLSARIDKLKRLVDSREYKIMIKSRELEKYTSDKYRRIVVSGSVFKIYFYNKLSEIKEKIKG